MLLHEQLTAKPSYSSIKHAVIRKVNDLEFESAADKIRWLDSYRNVIDIKVQHIDHILGELQARDVFVIDDGNQAFSKWIIVDSISCLVNPTCEHYIPRIVALFERQENLLEVMHAVLVVTEMLKRSERRV